MSDASQTPESSDLQADLRRDRGFSLAEAIGREGGSFLKGVSPVPQLVQVKAELHQLINTHLHDSSGVLKAVLQQAVTEDEVNVSNALDNPMSALCAYLQQRIDSPEYLYELVRRVDVAWGQWFGERPYFQKPGQEPHPEDEYTHASVKQQLEEFLVILHTVPPHLGRKEES